MESVKSSAKFPVLENDDGIRPNGKPDECFYCHKKVGEDHEDDCVCIVKKVKVQYTFDIEIEVPASWSEYEIEFHRNEGTWCATNAIDDLIAFDNECESGCLCNSFDCKYIEDTDKPPYRHVTKGRVDSAPKEERDAS